MHTFILELISTNREEIVKVNEYVAIATNYEAANNFYTVQFTYVPYILQEYLESDGNKLSSYDLVCNAVYTYPVRHKSRFLCRAI